MRGAVRARAREKEEPGSAGRGIGRRVLLGFRPAGHQLVHQANLSLTRGGEPDSKGHMKRLIAPGFAVAERADLFSDLKP